jgi:hypothetical protein
MTRTAGRRLTGFVVINRFCNSGVIGNIDASRCRMCLGIPGKIVELRSERRLNAPHG